MEAHNTDVTCNILGFSFDTIIEKQINANFCNVKTEFIQRTKLQLLLYSTLHFFHAQRILLVPLSQRHLMVPIPPLSFFLPCVLYHCNQLAQKKIHPVSAQAK